MEGRTRSQGNRGEGSRVSEPRVRREGHQTIVSLAFGVPEVCVWAYLIFVLELSVSLRPSVGLRSRSPGGGEGEG